MSRYYKILPLLILIAGLIAGCSTENPDAGTGCTLCHGYPPDGSPDRTGSPTQVDHTLVRDLADFLAAHDDCSTCHGVKNDGTGNPVTTGNYVVDLDHQDGNINLNLDTLYNINTYGCDSAGCHTGADPYQLSDSGLPVVLDSYGFGSGGCDSCHGYPPDGTDAQSAPGVLPGNGVDHSATAITGSHAECNVCHGFSLTYGATDNTANGGDAYSYHNDGTIEMNGWATDSGQDTQYNDTNFGCDIACHNPSNDPAHRLTSSGLPLQLHRYGSGDCLGCHDGIGAPVDINSPHSTTATGFTCEECHTAHSSGTVEIPNNPEVGINYTANGEAGIALGSTVATGASEAEICWNCHDTFSGISEWNAISDHGFTVTGGPNWTSTSFALNSAVIPNRPVLSMHSGDSSLPASTASSVQANIDWGNGNVLATNAASTISVTLENVSSIRCSYCHDVHDLNLAANDSTSGAPYLRGSWLHNPYLATAIERPPETGDTWTGNQWGHMGSVTVPRLKTDTNGTTAGQGSANAIGGFQIDQNNGYPTSSYLNTTKPNELTNTAGLCVLCHGDNPRLYDAYSDASDTRTLWLAGNGHANASLGGDGIGARNLFDARNRNGQLSTSMGFYMTGQGADNWDNLNNVADWGDQNVTGSNPNFDSKRKDLLPFGGSNGGGKPDEGNNSGNSATPPRRTGYYGGTANAARNTDTFDAGYNDWYSQSGIGSNTGATGRGHDFSCSKCHTPHASGLPALLVTNCLDYVISDWSETGTRNSIIIGPNSGANDGSSVTGSTNRFALEVMNNCHRKEDTSTGWHNLAPGQ